MPTQQSGEAEVNLLQMADLLEKSGNHHHAEILRLYEQKLRLTIFPMFRTKTMDELRDSEESFRLGRSAGIKEAMEALDQLRKNGTIMNDSCPSCLGGNMLANELLDSFESLIQKEV
jgi:hypothetical protein